MEAEGMTILWPGTEGRIATDVEGWPRTAPIALGMHLGWWGQMLDRTGGFRARNNGRFLRETGRFPFQCVTCECTVEGVEAHLRNNFSPTFSATHMS